MNFQQKLDAAIDKNNSLLCIGLDPVEEKLPSNAHNSFFEFNKEIINATHDLVCAFKPNAAFYEAQGEKGHEALKKTCEYITKTYPEVPLILDFKRGDIGNTNDGYAAMAFDELSVDAVTVHPYLGRESLEPFLDRKDKGIIILCRTSNPGAGEFQDLVVEGKPLYMHLAQQVVSTWNGNSNCLLVVGATYPEEMKKIRAMVGDMTFLVPGIGAQGGDVEKTVKAGINSQKRGMIISSSRGVIFAKNPRDEALKLRDEINKYR